MQVDAQLVCQIVRLELIYSGNVPNTRELHAVCFAAVWALLTDCLRTYQHSRQQETMTAASCNAVRGSVYQVQCSQHCCFHTPAAVLHPAVGPLPS